jgi:hypothetical protein
MLMLKVVHEFLDGAEKAFASARSDSIFLNFALRKIK